MKKKGLFLLLIISFNLAASYAHPITPTYFKWLHLDNAMFGMAYAMMSFGMFISSPFWGKMTYVLQSKTVMAYGSIGYAIGQLLFSIGRTSSFILAARLIAGLSCGAFFVGSLTYIAEHSRPEERGTLLTLNATIQTVAGAIGYFVGGLLGEVSLFMSFAIQIFQLALTGLAFFLLSHETKEEKFHLGVLKESNPFCAFMNAKLFMNKTFALLFMMSVLVFMGYTSLDQSFNYYLKDIFHLTSRYNGLIKGSVGLMSLVANMTIGLYIMRHTRISKSNSLLLLASSISLAIILMVKNVLLFIMIVMIFYGFYAIIIPVEQNMITSLSKKESRNLVLGFYQAIKSLGMILGSSIAGLIYTQNPMNPFLFALIAFMGSLIISMLFKEKKYYE